MFQKKYLEDPDLVFLSECSNEDLKTFADLLVFDKNDKQRATEELSKTRAYKEFYPKEMNKICREIIHEFQLFGGDTVANAIRGCGIPYREILMDVCDKKKVNYNKNSSIERIEMCFVQRILDEALEEMDEDEIKGIANDLRIDATKYDNKNALKDAIIMIGLSPQFVGKIVAICAKAIVPRIGIAVGGAMLGQLVARLVPIINIISLAFLAKELITGPAYRVTMPGVMMIIYMRRKWQDAQNKNN
ncbi:hypothetical protein B5F77_13050 [Parabacteroides sp. An277]|uniref:DUF3944 domain-containing protein n=1 Tax=Parabacteroides sp. An277 TaxID=1965619 RepID=UPI000B378A26|nr:DUF3944 domain-containing protein [Parabacteroides sp. An277]OUO50355.1 hypothetical protein B5F77_13050 [Parabacteroides sp. An277]